jgi:hypothetical protein
MGFGRSGTSLMAGILNKSGFFSGNDLYPGRDTNPYGFFENAYINGLNESILQKFDYSSLFNNSPIFKKQYSPYHPGVGQRWLTFISEDINIDHCDETINNSISEAVQIPGFAYKDPRFNYTLGIWNNHIKDDTLFICMFRQPDVTIGSVLKECGEAAYLSNFFIDTDLGYKLWFNSYSHLLKNLSNISNERKIFIHYEQLLKGEVVSILSHKLGNTLNTSLISPRLNRSKPVRMMIPAYVSKLYKELCVISGFRSASD